MCYEIVIFPIRKRHFRVRGWSGAFSEPLERKKDKTKCSFSIFRDLQSPLRAKKTCTHFFKGRSTNYQFRKFQTARSRLYQSRFLQPNTYFAAFFEIYKIHIPSHRFETQHLQICKILQKFGEFSRFLQILLKFQRKL